MKMVVDASAQQRGANYGAQFFETGLARSDFPPLAPLVRSLAALRAGPDLPEC